jgi:peptidoglycan/LPS O-acetylase OafA/YrhL
MLARITDIPTSQRPVLQYTFAFFAGFGHQAVLFFFVLSGYLVGGGLWAEHVRDGKLRLSKYFLKRWTRLAVAVYPSLLVVFAFNSIGIKVFRGLENHVYTAESWSNLGFGTCACNLLFLQTSLCGKFGDNGPLWSLYNEFWYYVVWPLVLLGFVAPKKLHRVCYLAAAVALLLGLSLREHGTYAVFGPYFGVWLLGFAVAAAERPVVRSTAVSAAVFLSTLLAERLLIRQQFATDHPAKYFLIDLLLSGAFATLLLAMRFKQDLPMPPAAHWNAPLAGFSFSLYLLHFPVLYLYTSFMMVYFHMGSNMRLRSSIEWGVLCGGAIVTLALSWIFSTLTEHHTNDIRRWISGWVFRGAKTGKDSLTYPLSDLTHSTGERT